MTNFKRYSELPFIAVIVPPGAFAYSAPRVTLYFNALRRGGALPFALPLTQDEELLASQLAGADGLLISGGIDIDPELYGGKRDRQVSYEPEFDLYGKSVFHAALRSGMPILGICRGLQIMNVSSGGTLIPDLGGAPGRRHASFDSRVGKACGNPGRRGCHSQQLSSSGGGSSWRGFPGCRHE